MYRKLLLILGVAVFFVWKIADLSAFEKYKVVDGDSLELGSLRIRLIDIDAPELFQECYDENIKSYECGKIAADFLKKIVSGGIKCQEVSLDIYKRSLMDCFDKSGENINRKMILNGLAISYGDRFIEEEKMAKDKKIGIWKGRFMRPELYRSLHKKEKNANKIKKR